MGDLSPLEQKISYASFARLGLLVTSEGRKFTDSDILHLDVVGTSITVLDSAKAAKDLQAGEKVFSLSKSV